jgi:hypothetical protein
MKQTKLMSFLETTLSTAIGFAVALATQILIFPLFGFNPSISENLVITLIFTVVSIARGFLLRRLFEALHIRRPLTPFMQAVIAERYRQIEQEGWSIEHDDDHERGELARAGAAYALNGAIIPNESSGVVAFRLWPWSREWWKPAGFRRDLVKACALIIAEGEKHDRQRKSKRIMREAA